MKYVDHDVIDFHTHPFSEDANNICSHVAYCDMSVDSTRRVFENLGVGKICGSVLSFSNKTPAGVSVWERIQADNEVALKLADYYGGFYIPGFHVHPDFVAESIAEIRRMHARGVKLIGELCPYMYGWQDYSSVGFSKILDEAEACGMVVSFHSSGEDEMDAMVKAHPGVVFVAAHPGEYGSFMRHLERMRMSDHYYLDLSGYGMFRHGMLKHAVDEFGAERFLFGSDYPTCNPAMYLGGVVLDELISEADKKKILFENAKRLLGL